MAKITKERKVTYYIGLGMMIIGFLLFISVFFFVANMMSNPMGIRSFPPFGNSVIGMILIIAGGIVSNIGARGAAGSGLILDPEQAREDLKPYTEATGGMINDVIRNIDIVDQITHTQEPKEIIKIKCRNCGAHNDEDAKFCKECGQEL
jgi:hypothetical protein